MSHSLLESFNLEGTASRMWVMIGLARLNTTNVEDLES